MEETKPVMGPTIFDIYIDVQCDFMFPDGKLHVPGAERLVEHIQDEIECLDADSAGALFTFDTHIREIYEQSEEAKQFALHCEKNTAGWQLAVDPFTAPVPIYWLEKPVFNMWETPGLRVQRMHGIGMDRDAFFLYLKANGVNTLRFRGVAADYCVKWAIEGALERGFNVLVVGHLTAGIERDMEQVIREDFDGKPVELAI